MGDCLKVGTRARGTIPNKVSDLENDLEFVTEKQLDEVIIKAQAGYHGLENETAKVEVDNLNRTIEVIAKGDDLKSTLPKDDEGKYIEGEYSLTAVVDLNGNVEFKWSKGAVVVSPYYYGAVSKAVTDLTSADIMALSSDGTIKGDRSYTFDVTKQRVVFAYPAGYGELNRIILVSTIEFNVTDSFQLVNMDIGGVPYYVYISYNSSTGTYNYQFKY